MRSPGFGRIVVYKPETADAETQDVVERVGFCVVVVVIIVIVVIVVIIVIVVIVLVLAGCRQLKRFQVSGQ